MHIGIFFKQKKIFFFSYEKKNRYAITSICLCRDLKLLIYLHFFAWEKPAVLLVVEEEEVVGSAKCFFLDCTIGYREEKVVQK